jgi:1-acyl-sn-glycerol-3-phosphate acyltransferase
MLRKALSPLLTVFAVTVVALMTLLLGSYLIVLVRLRPNTRQVTRVMRIWARIFLFVTATRAEVEGLEKLDPGASYVFTGNHTSNIDVPLTIGYLPVSVRFLAKMELFKVPILGGAMRGIHMVRTDRGAGTAAHREINEQVDRVVAEGLSLVIYPEGTRSRDGDLRSFKKGAFRIAIDNGLPVVPMTISGADRVWRSGWWLIFGGNVRMIVHEPISTEGMGPQEIEPLRDRVHAIVAETYQRIRA